MTVESAKKETRWDNNVSQRTLAEFIRDYQQHDLYMVQNVKDKMKGLVSFILLLFCFKDGVDTLMVTSVS